MWTYYLLIIVSVVMFGGGFALQDVYRKNRGSGLLISMESTFVGSIAGFVFLLIFNGFSFGVTWFTFLMALWGTLNGIAFTFCAFKALDYINLSLFSVFTMLGGMVLPFLQGIIFYGEGFTLAKGACVAFICAALACTVERGEKKNGTIFYVGVFVLNGMSGVISKIFTSTDLPKASAAEYSILGSMLTVVISGIILLVLVLQRRSGGNFGGGVEKRILYRSYGLGALMGAINKVANFILVIALMHVDASVQYPMVTGGVMIVSTLISFFGDKKPSRRDLISVGLAFVGMLALFLIPV